MTYIIRVKVKNGSYPDIEVDKDTIEEAHSFCDRMKKICKKDLESIRIYEFKELVY